MKRFLSFALVLCMLFALATPVNAGTITYDGDAGDFIFEPGSEYSPTDLFTNFKEVMPGDHLSQIITIRNKASNKVKIDLYVRSHGAHEGSEEFLSMLHMRVRVCDDNSMGYMFDAAASETAQLTDWVYLGTLYSGGEVDVEVILDVPVEMGNEHQNEIAYFLDWEFKIEEFPVHPDDPKPPDTGDMLSWLPAVVMTASGVGVFFLFFLIRNKKKEEDEPDAQVV